MMQAPISLLTAFTCGATDMTLTLIILGSAAFLVLCVAFVLVAAACSGPIHDLGKQEHPI